MSVAEKRPRDRSSLDSTGDLDLHPMKRRKLSRFSAKSDNATTWSPQSPSPSPPPILLQSTRITANGAYHSDSENESEISGIIFMENLSPHHALNNEKHDIPNGHSRHTDGHSANGIDDGHKDDDENGNNNEDEIEILLKPDQSLKHSSPSPSPPQLSPSPPWGRSPSPPPSEYFHKPTKKKSRWDDVSESASSKISKSKLQKSSSSSKKDPLLDSGVQSLINSIGLQQKQKKVEPLILDEHGNVIRRSHDVDGIDGEYNDDFYDIDGIDALHGSAFNDDEDTDDFIDPDIEVKPATRRSRGRAFKFVEQGTYTDRANTLRAMELQNSRDKPPRLDIELVAKKLQDDEGLEWLDRVPTVEWWDAPLLTDKSDYSSPYKKEMVTDLIENPKILRPELLREGVTHNMTGGHSGGGGGGGSGGDGCNGGGNGNSSAIPWILTKKERKKMKRMKKKEEHQARTDEIRLGLREPPEPRLKLSNIFRVLGTNAVKDPTAAESIARAQMWKRKMKHELHNAEKQLTAEQRREKKRRKLQEDTSKEVHVAIFVVYNLFGGLNKAKICLNAQQRNLTGGLLMLNTGWHEEGGKKEDDGMEEIIKRKEKMKGEDKKDIKGWDGKGQLSLNMVIVEGGPKGISKYTRLLMHRIDWSGQKENCQKIWTGTVAKRSFQTFHQRSMPTESDLKKFLKMHNVLSYWDMVHNSPAMTSSGIL